MEMANIRPLMTTPFSVWKSNIDQKQWKKLAGAGHWVEQS